MGKYKMDDIFSVSKLQLFKGVISNCRSQSLSETMGSITTRAFTKNVTGIVKTLFHHSTFFDMGNMTFKCDGEYPFRDGDKVVFYAKETNQAYWEVKIIKNFTRNYVVEYELGDILGDSIAGAIAGAIGGGILGKSAWNFISKIKAVRKIVVALEILISIFFVVFSIFMVSVVSSPTHVFGILAFYGIVGAIPAKIYFSNRKKYERFNEEIKNYPEF